MFSKMLGLALVFASSVALADKTIQLDSAVYLDDCGGYITLNKANNGDLSIQLHNVNTDRCDSLRVTDASSGRLIKQYDIRGTSYTLSNAMLDSLSDDCRVNFKVSGSFWSSDRFVVYIPWCVSRGGRIEYPRPYPRDIVTYEWSNNGNCKKMINGEFSGDLVSDYYCSGSPRRGGGHGRGRISYEWSNNHNCKKMIDGVFSGELVSDYYCH